MEHPYSFRSRDEIDSEKRGRSKTRKKNDHKRRFYSPWNNGQLYSRIHNKRFAQAEIKDRNRIKVVRGQKG